MSAYAEWKAGMITDAEYNSICREEWYEERMSRWAEGHDWTDDVDDEEEVFEDDEFIDEF